MIGILADEYDALKESLATIRRMADEITCPDAIGDKLRLELAANNLEDVLEECELMIPF